MQTYNGFNLIVGDFETQKLAYLINIRCERPVSLAPCRYGICIGLMNSNWPNVKRGKARFQQLLSSNSGHEDVDPQAMFNLVMNEKSQVYNEDELPDTGMPVEVEQLMSSIFIQPCSLRGAAYGTRSQTFLAVHRDGVGNLYERARPASPANADANTHLNVTWTEVHETFRWSASTSSSDQSCEDRS